MTRQRPSRTVLVILFLVTNLLTYAFATGRLAIPYVTGPAGGAISSRDLSDLRSIMAILEQTYVEKPSREKMIEGAKRGIVEGLGDPYSEYYTPKEWQEFLISMNATYAGVGMSIQLVDNFITVVEPFEGTPAYNAGLRRGDRVIQVDGRDIVGMTPDEAAQLIRGTPGTKVKLRVVPAGTSAPRDVELTRAQIEIPTVRSRMIDEKNKIGYIRLRSFSRPTADDFKDRVAQLEAQGMRGLILDLRDNGGGLLDAATQIASYFVPKGSPLFHEVGRSGERETTAAEAGAKIKVPFVLLVNEYSASASEIVAGAIQDHGLAPLVGVKTLGKGSVQGNFKLRDGAVVKVTTRRWHTPNGRSIHGSGIVPDHEVKMPPAEAGKQPPTLDDPKNPQLIKAIQVLLARIGG